MKQRTETKNLFPAKLLVLATVVVTGLSFLPVVWAADFTVANEAELSAAITAVNAAGAGDHTIALTADITLTAALPAFDNPDATGITLDGGGHVLDAAGTGTALAFQRGTVAEVRDITITGGAGSYGPDGHSGGGIFNMGALTVSDATISGNSAKNGAGIFNYAGEAGSASLTLTDVAVIDNDAADSGGGVAAFGATGEATTAIADSVINGNDAVNYGGGIANFGQSGSATLTLDNTTLDGNSSFLGAGIFNNGNNGEATATIDRSTLSNNVAGDSGGGLFNNGNLGGAKVSLTNSTVSGNSATSSGGGITNSANLGTAAMTLRFVTFAGNAAKNGGGFYNAPGGDADAAATIFAAGSIGKACLFGGGTTLTSNGYNLDVDGSCGLSGTGDVPNGNPALAALALNAPGDTRTHALGAGSGALQRVPAGAVGCGVEIAVDQRGATRPQGGTLCDIGAYESDLSGGSTPTPTNTPTATPSGTPPSPTPTVTGTPPTATPPATPTATATVVPPNCAPPYNPATAAELNYAIQCVNATSGGIQRITLAADIKLNGPTTPFDNLIADELVLDGDGHTIDGDFRGTVLTVTEGTIARFTDIRLINGQGNSGPGSNWGGAVYNRGDLTIEDSTLSGNLADRGGAIVNHSSSTGARLRLLRSTLSGNAAMIAGGGIYNLGVPGGTATVEMENVTLSGNIAAAGGGGLYNESQGGNATAEIRYATFGINTSSDKVGGGGIHTTASGGVSTVTLAASIIFNGTGSGPDCATPSGSIISNGYNLAGDGSCDLTSANDQPAVDPILMPLEMNPPGKTATYALGVGSPALNRIPPAATGCGTTTTTDQRGAIRPMPAGDKCDIGAYERQTKNPEVNARLLYLPMVIDR